MNPQLRESVLSSPNAATLRLLVRETEDRILTLAVLEVVKEDVESLGLNTVLLNDDTTASHHLSGVALTIDFAETGPGSEDLSISDLDEVDFVLGAESLNELDVLGLRAGLDENAQMGLALVEGLGALTETASETVVDESVLQDLLRGVLAWKQMR